MKKMFLISILILFASMSFSQITTNNPDTVCFQTSGSIYQLPNTPGLTYNWTVAAPGVLQSGQGTNQIIVDWSAAPAGTIVNGVTVTATDANGCTSNPVTLDIFIYGLNPSIAQLGPLCEGAACINLNASPQGGQFSGPGVVGNQFCSTVAGSGTHTITYTITLNGCTFTTTSDIIVNPIPVLTPIQHN